MPMPDDLTSSSSSSPQSNSLRRLASFLRSPQLSEETLRAGLAEYVFRSFREGKRVREYCTDVEVAFEETHLPLRFRRVLDVSSIKIFFPFTHLPASPHFPSAQPPLPSPLIHATALDTITTCQLVHTLAQLSYDLQSLSHASATAIYLEERINEVCLEYVGRRWCSIYTPRDAGSNVVDEISKKLTEVEFEVQLQGDAPTVRSTILPVLHKVRFCLGFVTSSQLATRLNGMHRPSSSALVPSSPTTTFDPFQLICAWVERRLHSGLRSQAILSDLESIEYRLHLKDQDTLAYVLSQSRVETRPPLNTSVRFKHFSSPPPTPTASTVSRSKRTKRARSLTFLAPKMTGKKGLRPPMWFSHKRNSSSSSRLHLSLSDCRRPSLPGDDSFHALPLSRSGDSLDVRTLRSSASTSTLRPPFTTYNEIFSALMAFTDPEDIQAFIHKQLIVLRYHIQGREDEGWFIGGGKAYAENLVDYLEQHLVRGRDVMGLRELFEELRVDFQLDTAINSSDLRPSALEHDPGSRLPFAHHRDMSFDLDQYLSVLSPTTNTEVSSTHNSTHITLSRASVNSISILTSDSQQSEHTSRLSDYTIREAKVAYRQDTRATECQLSPRPPSFIRATDDLEEQHELHDRYERYSASSPDLAESPYTRLPPKVGTLRRSAQRIHRMSQLSNFRQTTEAYQPVFDASTVPGEDSRPISHQSSTGLLTPLPSQRSLSSPEDSHLLTPPPVDDRRLSVAQRHRRTMHRSFKVFDGAPLTPSPQSSPISLKKFQSNADELRASSPPAPSWEVKGLSVDSRTSLSSASSAEIDMMSTPRSRIPPRISSLNAPVSRRVSFGPSPLPACVFTSAHSRDSEPTPLAAILKLFVGGKARPDLTLKMVEKALEQAVELEKLGNGRDGQWDAEGRTRMLWLIEQVAELLDDSFSPIIEPIIMALSNPHQLPTELRPKSKPKPPLQPLASIPRQHSSVTAPQPQPGYAKHRPAPISLRRLRSDDSLSSTYSSPSTSAQSEYLRSPISRHVENRKAGTVSSGFQLEQTRPGLSWANEKGGERVREPTSGSTETFGRKVSLASVASIVLAD